MLEFEDCVNLIKISDAIDAIDTFVSDEDKRCKIFSLWILEIIELLVDPVGSIIWGNGMLVCDQPTYTIEIDEYIYFRYRSNEIEDTGFYRSDPCSILSSCHGTPISDLQGTQLWKSIKKIINWVDKIPQILKEKSEKRNRTINKLGEISDL